VQRTFTVVDIIKQRKLQLFGHICRMPDKKLIKITMDMVDGDRHRGGPPRRWVKDIVDWCGHPLPKVVQSDGRQRSVEKSRHWNQRLTRAMS